MKYRKKSIAAIIIFAVMTGSAYLVWPFVRGKLEGENTENRNLAEFPKFSWETLSDYPSQIESYVDDNLPFRSKMIEFNSMICYYLLDTPTSTLVAKGHDDWLFYKDAGDGDPMSDYTGRKLYSEEQLQRIARNMMMAKENCEAQGTKFVLFIAPNRERVYWEEMPSYYGAPAEENDLRQVVEYLRANTDVTVVCPYDDLMTAKEQNPSMNLYHKTDTHWNYLGGYIGACDLFNAVGAKWDDSNIVIHESQDIPGDMANFLNLGDVIETGNDYTLTGYEHSDTEVIGEEVFGEHWTYSSPSAANGSILVRRDSFWTSVAPYIKESFKYSDMVHSATFTNDLVESEQPDIFVFECVERYMDGLISWSYNNLSFETDFGRYLDKLLTDRDRYTVFISAKDEASSALTPELIEKLHELGIQTDLTGKYRYSFYSVIDGGNVVSEDIGTSLLGKQSQLADGTAYSITSAGYDCGSASSVVIDGEEYSKEGRG